MSFDRNLLVGFAQLLSTSVADVTWRATGAYQPADPTPIVIGGMPQTPDRVVTLMTYPLSDDPVLNMSDVGVQIRTRGTPNDPLDVADLDSDIADQLLGRFPLTLPNGIHISVLIRSSSTSLGQDGDNRWERSSNYTATVNRPSPYRF